LLVGGLGTRLRPVVASAPKPLASVGDRPFLELLVRQLGYQGIHRLVFCTGYLADEIEKRFGDGQAWDATIEYSKELRPMGTAGAVKLAEPFLRDSTDFLVMNGDSFMEIDFQNLIHFHRSMGGIATLAILQMKNSMRYGTVQVAHGDRIVGFAEKSNSDSTGFINTGIYVFNRRIFDHIPEGLPAAGGSVSLEKDVFPNLVEHGLFASKQNGMFIDIGTPEDYARAQDLSKMLYKAASQKASPGISD
jgi:NDP-sugar pyrophosphorylase family protein